jgi:hypothetical protein
LTDGGRNGRTMGNSAAQWAVVIFRGFAIAFLLAQFSKSPRFCQWTHYQEPLRQSGQRKNDQCSKGAAAVSVTASGFIQRRALTIHYGQLG